MIGVMGIPDQYSIEAKMRQVTHGETCLYEEPNTEIGHDYSKPFRLKKDLISLDNKVNDILQ